MRALSARTLMVTWMLLIAAVAPCMAEGGIAWHGTWAAARAAAQASGKPILLVSAAPHCHNVSGIW